MGKIDIVTVGGGKHMIRDDELETFMKVFTLMLIMDDEKTIAHHKLFDTHSKGAGVLLDFKRKLREGT